MKHETRETIIEGHAVTLFTEPAPEVLLIQPTDSHDMEEMESEITYIENHANMSFMLAAVKISKWNDEISPWPAPPVFGKIPFGNGAQKTLEFITGSLLPELKESYNFSSIVLGGYSLAGLFSLWSSYQTDAFNAIVAASPSVWFNDWLDYSTENECHSGSIYLSLGDRESHSKNKLMSTVGEAIQKQKKILDEKGIRNTLVWNPGNHFMDNGIRTAKGFVWSMNQ